jgi:hypothetical protein
LLFLLLGEKVSMRADENTNLNRLSKIISKIRVPSVAEKQLVKIRAIRVIEFFD